MINSLSLPGYQLVDSDEQNEDIHFRLEAPTPVACEGCGVQGEFTYRKLKNQSIPLSTPYAT